MCYQCNKSHLQIIQFSVNRWILLPAQVLQRELSMGYLSPQLQNLCPAQLQVSFPLLCNVLILAIICYCYVLYYLCRFLFNRTLNFCPEFNYFFTIYFSSTDYTGYIQDVQEVQESKSSKNLYFDISLLSAKDKTQLVRVMVQRGESSKRQLFLQKMQSQQPVTLSNLQVASSNMVLLNRRTVIQDAPPHSIHWPQ